MNTIAIVGMLDRSCKIGKLPTRPILLGGLGYSFIFLVGVLTIRYNEEMGQSG